MPENNCDFRPVTPLMLPFPYPPIKVEKEDIACANVLSINYCGAVSELTAITQYINNQSCLSQKHCHAAQTILGIAMAEMIHLQKLGELICLLGGTLDYKSRWRDGSEKLWTPECLKLTENPRDMLRFGIESENAAIRQYEMHMRVIKDANVNAVLARIIKDEEYHIMLFKILLRECAD